MGTDNFEPVDIVVPVYNAVEALRKCVHAVRHNTDYPYRLILADDCSPDSRVKTYMQSVLQQSMGDRHQAIAFSSPKNLGFAGINNLAVERFSTSKYICLLNEDTEAFPGWLSALVGALESAPTVGIVGAMLIFSQDREPPMKGRIQHIGVARGQDGAPFHPFRGQPCSIRAARYRREVNAVTGACMLIRRAVWHQVGGLDTQFIRGQFEDVDFCWKARQCGWRILVEPHAKLYHYEHGSGEQYVFEHHDHNRELLMTRWQHLPSDTDLFRIHKEPDAE